MKRVWIFVLALLITLASFAGAQAKSSLVDEVMKRGVLKVGMDIFVPWSFKDKNGNLVGFEVDVARKLAQDMGVKAEFVPTAWAGIIPSLLTGKFDVIIGGMGITTERAIKVNFTIPYEEGGQDVVVNKKMLPKVSGFQDLNKESIVISVHMGATPVAAAKKYFPKAQLHQFDNDPAVIQDVLNGNAHAAISSSPTPAFWASDYPDKLYRPFGGQLITFEPGSFALRKGDPEAIFFFNAWITTSRDYLKERFDYWFGTKDWKDMIAE